MRPEISKDIFLPGACNYALSFPEALSRGIRFVHKGDDDYPLLCCDYAPECLSVLGRLKRRRAVILSAKGMSTRLFEDAMLFSFEASYAGYDVVFRDGSFSYTAKMLAAEQRAPVFLLSCGALELSSHRRMLLDVNGGAISPFLPFQERSPESRFLADRIISCFPLIVLFGVSRYEYMIASDALDNGADVYLHRSSLVYPLARRLAGEGVPVVDHIDNEKGIVYRNDSGSCSFLAL